MTRFRERVGPSIGLWLAMLLIVPASLLSFLPINIWMGVVGAVVLLAAAVVFLVATTPTIEVADEALRAGRARLPIRFVGAAEAIRGEAAVQARGPGLDARAWSLLRGWVKDVVRIENTDAADPAPYWLVSTRRPDELVAALEAARAAAPPVE